MQKYHFQFSSVVFTAIMTALLLGFSLNLTSGVLVYSLDDPYIHLSVAENILIGGYGVNGGEFASPSSSIIYPFILAIGLFLGLGDWAPFWINLSAALATSWMVAGLLWNVSIQDGRKAAIYSACFLLPLLLLAFNTAGLIFTGMEHSLQITIAVLLMSGLIALDKDKPVPLTLSAAIIFCTLIRFEGLALSGAALIALIYHGHKRPALYTGGALALLLMLYAGVMIALDLPPLPSSVLSKSSVTADAVDGRYSSFIKSIYSSIFTALKGRYGVSILFAAALILIGISRPGTSKTQRTVAFAALLGLAAHLVAGRYGWFGRYEVYIVAVSLIALGVIFQDVLKADKGSTLVRTSAIGLLLFTIATPYLITHMRTPAASENIYAQHYQMHRFSKDFFPHPVAINDLGYVSYNNDVSVLDLAGLGSEKARRMQRLEGRRTAVIDELTQTHGSVYAMVYDHWFPTQIPDHWCKVATLHTPHLTSGSGEVVFYLLEKSYLNEMKTALRDFSNVLPRQSRLTFGSC